MYNNHMNKIFTLWKNLIKRKSFHIFLYLTLLELFTTIALKSKIKFNIFLYLHLFYFILNICCTYVLYKKEEKHSQFITNNLLLNNKLYNFLLSILSVISIIYFFFICCMAKILIIYWTLWSLVLLSHLLVYLFSNYY